MLDRFRRRYLDLLGSIYVYNEHRGYTAIDRVIEAIRTRSPEDSAFLAAVEKHRADERKHYEMFRRWFQLRGVMPFAVGRTCGHIDRFVEIMFGSSIDHLNTHNLVASDLLFAKLSAGRSQSGAQPPGGLSGSHRARSARVFTRYQNA